MLFTLVSVVIQCLIPAPFRSALAQRLLQLSVNASLLLGLPEAAIYEHMPLLFAR